MCLSVCVCHLQVSNAQALNLLPGRNVHVVREISTIPVMNRIIAIALLFATTCMAPAQVAVNPPNALTWKPPVIWKSDALPKATVPKEMVSKLQVSDMTVVLEKNEMTEIQRRFSGTFGTEGDAADALEWLCLIGSDTAGPWVLWVESGEMDAGTVGSFQWRRVSRNSKFDDRCATLPKDNGGVALPIALKLGTSSANVLQVLGQPTLRRGDTLFYVHEHEGSDKKGEFTALNTLAVVVRDGRVWAIEVLKASFAD